MWPGCSACARSSGSTLFATGEILAVLAANPIFDALDPALVRRRPVALGGRSSLCRG